MSSNLVGKFSKKYERISEPPVLEEEKLSVEDTRGVRFNEELQYEDDQPTEIRSRFREEKSQEAPRVGKYQRRLENRTSKFGSRSGSRTREQLNEEE